MNTTQHREPWPAPAIDCVFVELPRCPVCGSTKHSVYKTISDQGDGSKLQYATCANGHRFKIVSE